MIAEFLNISELGAVNQTTSTKHSLSDCGKAAKQLPIQNVPDHETSVMTANNYRDLGDSQLVVADPHQEAAIPKSTS